MKAEELLKGRSPDFKGDGVAVWVNKTAEGKKYLNIKLVGHMTISAFYVDDYPKKNNDAQPSNV